MSRCIINVLACCVIVAVASWKPADAAVDQTYSFTLARAPHPLALDPSLTDPAWKAGLVPGGAWQDVTTHAPAGEATTAYALYDDRYLYVAFVAAQPLDPIVASQITNDVGFGNDDFVAVGVDTSGNGSQAYFFETTPRGVRYEQASENVRYRPSWFSAASVSGQTWRAVMRIPLSSLRVRPNTRIWRIGFFRGVAARAEHLTWAYDPTMQDEPSGSWPSFLDLRFWPSAAIAVSAAKPKPRLEVFTLQSVGLDHDRYQQARGGFAAERTRTYGLDFSVPLTTTINLVGTANPDFSNVETDQQTIAPQEFPRFLTEYRPFFAQGASFVNPNPAGYNNFNAPTNKIFYSPSVGPFDSGAKLEGTYGMQSFGLLTFRGYDLTTGTTFDDQIFGYQHAVPGGTFQYWADGVLGHHSRSGTDNTYEIGALGRNYRTGLFWSVNGASESGTFVSNGSARSVNSRLAIIKPNYQLVLGYGNISPTYHPIDGFTTFTDTRGFSGYINVNGSTEAIKSWAFFVQGDRLFDSSGAVHETDNNVFLTAVFKNGLSLNGLGPSTSELRSYNGNFFTGYPSYSNPSTTAFNMMNVPIGYRDGSSSPVDASASWGSFGGNWQQFYTISTSRPLGSQYTLGLEYDASYQRSLSTGVLDSQFLRRVSIGFNLNAATNLTLGVRDINGLGGFAPHTGLNLAAGFHERFSSGDLYAYFGSPSAFATLNRFIVKYVFRAGGDAGT